MYYLTMTNKHYIISEARNLFKKLSFEYLKPEYYCIAFTIYKHVHNDKIKFQQVIKLISKWLINSK